jgi:hypothetical protein
VSQRRARAARRGVCECADAPHRSQETLRYLTDGGTISASKALRRRGQIGLEVKKLIVVGSGATGALAVSALLGCGVASADDYAGQTYSDAFSAASGAGQTVVVAARTGDKLDQGDCIVERSQAAPFASANDGIHVSDTVQFYLNCNGGYATANTPGTSLGGQEGREAKAAADQAAADDMPGAPGA